MPAQPDFESCPRNNKNYRKDEKGLSRNIHARYLARLAPAKRSQHHSKPDIRYSRPPSITVKLRFTRIGRFGSNGSTASIKSPGGGFKYDKAANGGGP
jgi:hypothetical protein